MGSKVPDQADLEHEFQVGDKVENDLGTRWIIRAVYWDVGREVLRYFVTWGNSSSETVVPAHDFEDSFEKIGEV